MARHINKTGDYMPYIYKITNDINNKVYIGKTLSTIDKRWKEHQRDSQKRRCEQRPLYSAIRKYGIEHFHIEQIEETTFENINEREKYWIKYYNSYGRDGYNGTEGGDGKQFFNYEEIYNLWQEGFTVPEIIRQIGCCEDTVDSALKNFQVSSEERIKRKIDSSCKQVQMLDKTTNQPIITFSSITDAYEWLQKPKSSHITEVANGKRKQAYGYKWRWV